MISAVQIKCILYTQVKHAQSPQKDGPKKESNLVIDSWKRMYLKHETYVVWTTSATFVRVLQPH